MGENLKVVWADFSTLSQAVLLKRNMSKYNTHSHFSTCKLGPGFVPLGKVCPWFLFCIGQPSLPGMVRPIVQAHIHPSVEEVAVWAGYEALVEVCIQECADCWRASTNTRFRVNKEGKKEKSI